MKLCIDIGLARDNGAPENSDRKMKSWSSSRIAIIALLGSVVATVLWLREQYQYHALEPYGCDERKALVVPLRNLVRRDRLELYVGGWIERGQVTISGLPSRDADTLRFSRGASVGTVSHAYIGEWYEPSIEMLFEPLPGSSCFIRVVYRYQ